MIYFTVSKPADAWLNGILTSRWRDSMVNQPIAQEHRGAGAWLGSLVEKFLDYVDTLGGKVGLPTCAEELHYRPVKVEARADRLGR
jgi:hypothetical protein